MLKCSTAVCHLKYPVMRALRTALDRLRRRHIWISEYSHLAWWLITGSPCRFCVGLRITLVAMALVYFLR